MKFKSNIELQAGLEDASGSPGTVNQLLSSTATGTAWIDPSTIVVEAAAVVVIACKNTSGATITKGTPVYQTGTVGATATIEIAPADALISANKLPAIGLLQTDLNNNGFGNVVITGELTNFTTDPIDGLTPTVGDKIFVKSGGGLTLTKPTGEGNGIQNMGLVGKVSGGNAGSITVSSIMRTNDVPNLPEGRIWVGDGNTIVSDTVYVDEPNNRVGIGTSSPSKTLTVGGTGLRVLGTASADFYSTAQDALIVNNGTANLRFWNNGAERLRIDSSGNVGIGTTSPNKKLEVSAAADTTISIASSDTSINVGQNIGILEFASNNETSLSQAYTPFSKIKTISESAVTGTGSVNGAITFETASVNIFEERMRITSTGNVGIGVIDPEKKLEVKSDTTYDGIMLDVLSAPEITFRDRGNSDTIIGTGRHQLDGFHIDTYSGNALLIKGSNRFVGIGTTSPGEKLDVNGNIKASGTATFGADLTVKGNINIWGNNGSLAGQIQANSSGGGLYLNAVGTNQNIRLVPTGTGFVQVTTSLDVLGGGTFGDNILLNNAVDGTKYITYNIANSAVNSSNKGGFQINEGGATQVTLDYVRDGSGLAKLFTTGTNRLTFGTNSIERMRISEGGNVGIGTTSPSEKLEVVGNIELSGNIKDSASSSYYIDLNGTSQLNHLKCISTLSFGNFTAGVQGTIFEGYSTHSVVRTDSARLDFYSGQTGGVGTMMSLKANGNVGIGTTSPSTTLDVNGIVTATGGNSTQWNTAYDNSITTAAVTGTTTKTLTLTQQDAGTITTSWTDNNTDTNYYTTTATFNTADGVISFSGAGGQPAYSVDLDGRYTANTGTVTSVGISHAGNAFITGSAVTTSGNLDITMAGTAAQYVNGLGNLITFPAIPQGDITAVIAGSGLSGGGTTGSVTLNAVSLPSFDTRSTNPAPNATSNGVRYDFKTNTTNGLSDGGTYNGQMTWRSYSTATDLTGGMPMNIAYTANGNLWTRIGSTATTWDTWYKLWSSGNDGAGSGLDADLLDGQQGSYYAPATGGNYLPLSAGSSYPLTGDLYVGTSTASTDRFVRTYHSDNSYTEMRGYGIITNRTGSYYRPANDKTQGLAIGNDGNTWNYVSQNANYHTFSKDTSEWMRIDITGNVGIGTTSPDNLLHLTNTSGNSIIRMSGGGSLGDTYGGFIKGYGVAGQGGKLEIGVVDNSTFKTAIKVGSQSNELQFSTANSERMRIDSSGNVGIGTTSPTAAAKLTVMGNQTFGLPGNGTNTSGRFISIEGNTDGSGESSSRIFFTEHNSTTAAMDNYGMSLSYRGGATSIVGASGNTWTGLTQIGNGEWGMFGHDNNATGVKIMQGSRSATYTAFYSSGSETMRITGGNVGIGTTSPSEKLEVAGNVILDASNARLKIKGGVNGTNSGIDWTFNTDSTSYAKIELDYDTRASTGLLIDSGYPMTLDYSSGTFSIKKNGSNEFNILNGNVGIGTTSPVYKLDVAGTGRFTSTVTATNFILSSDERKKTKIKDLSRDNIDVSWKSFEMKSDEGEYRVGVIAQELEVKHPEFVNTDNEGFKSVKYIDLLIAKIAELEARLEKAGL